MERRLFHRESIAMNGDLSWVTKGRLGRKQTQRSYVRTLNLSLDGARIELKGHYPFLVDAVARIQLGIRYCDVRILDVVHTGERTILRIFFISPDPDFVSVIEDQLPSLTADRELHERKWTA